MSGRTIGNLILMTLVCVVIFVVFMAMRPAPAGETPIYGPDGKYKGSVFDYGRTQTYTDRNGHFPGPPLTTATAPRRSSTAAATSPGRPGRRSTGRSTSTGDEVLALSGRYPKNFNARPSSGFFPSYARAAAPVAGTCGRGSKWHCVLRADCFGCG